MESSQYHTLIDALCDEYERQLKSGNAPEPETFINGVSSDVQPVLLRELNALPEKCGRSLAAPRTSGEDDRSLLQQETVESGAADRSPESDADSGWLNSSVPNDPNKLAPAARMQTSIASLSVLQSAEARALAERFTLHRELGFGRFGRVFLATDNNLGRQVAVKIARAEVFQSAELRARFLREARAIARLEHPGIVRV